MPASVSLVAHLEECYRSLGDIPPPSPEQYTEKIKATEFEVVTFVGVGLDMTIARTVVGVPEAAFERA